MSGNGMIVTSSRRPVRPLFPALLRVPARLASIDAYVTGMRFGGPVVPAVPISAATPWCDGADAAPASTCHVRSVGSSDAGRISAPTGSTAARSCSARRGDERDEAGPAEQHREDGGDPTGLVREHDGDGRPVGDAGRREGRGRWCRWRR